MRIQEILNESLMDVEGDVNMIYDRFFRDDIEKAQTTGYIGYDMFQRVDVDSSMLKDNLSQQAHAVNPVSIIINKKTAENAYFPSNRKISITINWYAFDYAVWNHNGNLEKATNSLSGNQKIRFKQEFKEEKIKGSIHHELVHWIDDSLHNKHISKRVDLAIKSNTDLTRKNIPIDADPVEIQSQIHNVLQIKKKHPDLWDILSFEEMVEFSPVLVVINDSLKEPYLSQWKKSLKKRMAREGLLGKLMR